MKKTEKIFKTIVCSDINEFDVLILKHTNIGWKKIIGGYSYSWNNIHSQIMELGTSNYNYINTFENGSVKILGNIQNEKKEGTWYSFNKEGIFHQEANYHNGKEHGEWIYFYSDGTIKKREFYQNGDLIKYIKDNEIIEFNK